MTGRTGVYLAMGLCLLTAAYGLFQARALINGPSLSVHSPAPGETVAGVMMHVAGVADNVTRVSVNGRAVTMTLDGAFSEQFTTPEGYGVVLIEAQDRFGRTVSERVEFVGRPEYEPLPTSTTN
jgi:hypothetical protein